jgi:hypothetical protein
MALTKAKTIRTAPHLKLSLAQNAYNFLNQSLRHYRKSRRDVQEWPFALLHITQTLELLLKHLLQGIHPILIYDDIDKPKQTVSLEHALGRLTTLGFVFEEKERLNIHRAAEYRNRVVHYEVELNKFEWKNIYAQLFEFLHFFHYKHLNAELHAHIHKNNWAVEAHLMLYFKKNFVVYNGVEMWKENPKDILEAQTQPYFYRGRRRYARFQYGDEPTWLELDPNFAQHHPCHDCLVLKGQYHTEGCDVEECPRCHGQLLGCGCWL